MVSTRKARVPMVEQEQIRLINECRQSGMTDADWCRENDIAVNTFYNWVSRCRKVAADQILAVNYGHFEVSRLKQDVIPIDFEEINDTPVVYHWKYRLDEINPNEEAQVETLSLEKSS